VIIGNGIVGKRKRVWTPKTPADLALWLDAADRDTIGAPAGHLLTWSDKSGTEKTVSVVGHEGNSPAWSATTMGTLPGVRWYDNTLGILGHATIAGLDTLTAATAFLVLKCQDAAFTDYQMDQLWQMGATAATGLTSHYHSADGGALYENFGSTVRRDSIAYPAGLDASTPHLYEIQAATNYWRAWINGSPLLDAITTNTFGIVSPANLAVYDTADVRNHFRGSYAELLIYGRQLTADEQKAVRTYLKTKWALAGVTP
jgi:hypothetical protein